MLPYIVGAVIGAALMGRTKPKVPMKTMQCFGPRTGVVWTAELFPGSEVVVIHAPAPDPTIALFQRDEHGRFTLLRPVRGYAQTVEFMRKDLES